MTRRRGGSGFAFHTARTSIYPVVAFTLFKELTKTSVFETERDDAVEGVQRDSRTGSRVRRNKGIEERRNE
jgi:hypothetical protein